MQTAEALLKEVQSLNEAEKYNEVLEILTEDILETERNADLFAEKAQAYWRLDQYELCEDAVNKALSIAPENAKANLYKGSTYWKKGEYDNAEKSFIQALKTEPNFAAPYHGLGLINIESKNYNKAIEYLNKAIEIDNNYIPSYNSLGNIYRKQKKYFDAIKSYNQALKIDPHYSYSYNSLGNTYFELKKYNKAIECYNKAVSINSKEVTYYHNLGVAYGVLDDYKKSIQYYTKAIKIDPLYGRSYYGRAFIYQKFEKYEQALSNYKTYIEFTTDDTDYFKSLAKSKVIELEDIIQNPELSFINELVGKIKDLLLFKDECITHYTSFSTTTALILKNSLFRLSEGTYLNDTSEGRELFDFLPHLPSSSLKTNDTIAKQFTSKPFIGSFVAETKHDDLTLWRMYGKEDKEEARGCALTLNREYFLENLRNLLIPESTSDATEKTNEEFNFYRVAYRKKDSKDSFIIPGASKKEEELNKLMFDLKEKLEKVLEEKDQIISIRNWSELNQIAYLFKSAEYQYEHELRLIVKSTGITKIINEDIPPRVYIELIAINPLIRKITFGPKVDKADEWASAFYYTLDKQGFYPDIFISHLPFK